MRKNLLLSFGSISIAAIFLVCSNPMSSIDSEISEEMGTPILNISQADTASLEKIAFLELPLKVIKKLITQSKSMYANLKNGLKYAKKGKSFLKYINKAIDIGRGMNEFVIYRDQFGEAAFESGRNAGIRDAKRFKSDPVHGAIDIDRRSLYARRGEKYGLVYDAGYAAGWRYVFN